MRHPTGVAGKRAAHVATAAGDTDRGQPLLMPLADCEAVGGALSAASHQPLQLEQALQQLPRVQPSDNQHDQGISLQVPTVQNTTVDATLSGPASQVQ